ncbi:unnamed protein product [Larinioides sclopetarius]|uniref:Uncharacterized protein n=1 Tax=Larinioides sclopetarius TaxID=280406 RepID=A0AAV2BDL4_9ARAC
MYRQVHRLALLLVRGPQEKEEDLKSEGIERIETEITKDMIMILITIYTEIAPSMQKAIGTKRWPRILPS